MKMSSSVNTVYIISKGRPNCTTAQTLTKIGYPGQWFIVCGNNDEKLEEYKETWGEARILVFDWYEEVKESNLLDNFGVENMSSGAVPVRNATRKISYERGEVRHWQFDDDYTAFYTFRKREGRVMNSKLEGKGLEKYLLLIAEFANNANLSNAGFSVYAEARPESVFEVSKRVFNAHNMPSDEATFQRWIGRMNDDLINAIETWRTGKVEMSFKFLLLTMKATQSETGGNTDIYKAHGTVRKAAYAVLVEPKAVKLVVKYGRYHHSVDWRSVCPKLIREKIV